MLSSLTCEVNRRAALVFAPSRGMCSSHVAKSRLERELSFITSRSHEFNFGGVFAFSTLLLRLLTLALACDRSMTKGFDIETLDCCVCIPYTYLCHGHDSVRFLSTLQVLAFGILRSRTVFHTGMRGILRSVFC